MLRGELTGYQGEWRWLEVLNQREADWGQDPPHTGSCRSSKKKQKRTWDSVLLTPLASSIKPGSSQAGGCCRSPTGRKILGPPFVYLGSIINDTSLKSSRLKYHSYQKLLALLHPPTTGGFSLGLTSARKINCGLDSPSAKLYEHILLCLWVAYKYIFFSMYAPPAGRLGFDMAAFTGEQI